MRAPFGASGPAAPGPAPRRGFAALLFRGGRAVFGWCRLGPCGALLPFSGGAVFGWGSPLRPPPAAPAGGSGGPRPDGASPGPRGSPASHTSARVPARPGRYPVGVFRPGSLSVNCQPGFRPLPGARSICGLAGALCSLRVAPPGPTRPVCSPRPCCLHGFFQGALDIRPVPWYAEFPRPVPLLRGPPLPGCPWTARKPLGLIDQAAFSMRSALASAAPCRSLILVMSPPNATKPLSFCCVRTKSKYIPAANSEPSFPCCASGSVRQQNNGFVSFGSSEPPPSDIILHHAAPSVKPFSGRAWPGGGLPWRKGSCRPWHR